MKEIKKLKKEILTLENEIMTLEESSKTQNEELAAASQKSDGDKIRELSRALKQIQKQIEASFDKLMHLHERVGKLE